MTHIDVTLVRNFRLFEKIELQLRAEAFNLLNVPHFRTPVTAMSSCLVCYSLR
ncbi:MAG TPA: hypothetical protein VGL72_28535 [Bryobacteraceae bacterium]